MAASLRRTARLVGTRSGRGASNTAPNGPERIGDGRRHASSSPPTPRTACQPNRHANGRTAHSPRPASGPARLSFAPAEAAVRELFCSPPGSWCACRCAPAPGACPLLARPHVPGEGTCAQIAAAAGWSTHQVPTCSGKAGVWHIATAAGRRWYGPLHTTLVTVVLARGEHSSTGCDCGPGSPGALLHRGLSGPRVPLIAARGPSKPLGRFRSSAAARCFPPPGRMSAPVAGGVYEVCSLAACGAGRVVVDQVVRRDRLLGDPQEPVFPALGGLRWLVGGQQVFPHRLHRPSCLDGRRTVQESSGGFTFWRRCAQHPARAGHRVMPRLQITAVGLQISAPRTPHRTQLDSRLRSASPVSPASASASAGQVLVTSCGTDRANSST